MPTWPNTLPDFPEAMSYQEQAKSQLLRTEMDAGPAKVRRRYTAGTVNFSVQWLLDRTKLDALETFFNTTLGAGALSFTFIHPRKGGSKEGSYRFVEPYSVSPSNHPEFWVVVAKLEKLP